MKNSTDTQTFDIAIVGAGAGGLTVAAVASQLGRKVCLLEKGKMGGDCLNYGCIPSKALLAAAKRGATFQEAMAHVHTTVKAISHHDSQERFEGLGCAVIREAGTFTDANTLGTPSGKRIQAKRFVIATGSCPFVPPIEGLDVVDYLTNETVFSLKEKPEHLLVLGAGPIGLEMAQAFHLLGVKVTVLEAGRRFLRNDEPELAQQLRERLKAQGIVFHMGTLAKVVKDTEKGISFTAEDVDTKAPITLQGSHLLVATGRTPNTDSLNLEKVGIKTTASGHIETSTGQRTSNKRVFAVGDCTGPFAFTHMAGKQAGTVIQRLLFANIFAKTAYHAVPWVTYTTPELAHVGETEATATEKFGKKVVQTVLLKGHEVDRFMAEAVPLKSHGLDNEPLQKEAMLKVVIGKKGRILGASLLAEKAGEILSPFYVLVSQKQSMKALSGVTFPYPTHAEIAVKATSQYYGKILYSDKVKRISSILWRLLS